VGTFGYFGFEINSKDRPHVKEYKIVLNSIEFIN
jgi:hypothetical protein